MRRYMNGVCFDRENSNNNSRHTYNSPDGTSYSCYTSGFHDDGFSVWVPQLSKTFWVRWDQYGPVLVGGESDDG